jgi:hypothetical protein
MSCSVGASSVSLWYQREKLAGGRGAGYRSGYSAQGRERRPPASGDITRYGVSCVRVFPWPGRRAEPPCGLALAISCAIVVMHAVPWRASPIFTAPALSCACRDNCPSPGGLSSGPNHDRVSGRTVERLIWIKAVPLARTLPGMLGQSCALIFRMPAGGGVRMCHLILFH